MNASTDPRAEVVAALTRVDLLSIAQGRELDLAGRPADPADVALALSATASELEGARRILAQRFALRTVGGDRP